MHLQRADACYARARIIGVRYMKLVFTLKDQWNLVKPIWRVLLLILIVQIISGVISLLSSPYNNAFVDFWYGGAISTLLGFLFGAIWHQYSSSSKLQNHKFAICFIGLICASIMLAAIFFPLEHIASEINRNK